jgi:hypothetical protein
MARPRPNQRNSLPRPLPPTAAHLKDHARTCRHHRPRIYSAPAAHSAIPRPLYAALPPPRPYVRLPRTRTPGPLLHRPQKTSQAPNSPPMPSPPAGCPRQTSLPTHPPPHLRLATLLTRHQDGTTASWTPYSGTTRRRRRIASR